MIGPFTKKILERYGENYEVDGPEVPFFLDISIEADVLDNILRWSMVLRKHKRVQALQDVIDYLKRENLG